MTTIRVAISATTPRSCVIERDGHADPALEVRQQSEYLRLNRDIETRRRLVGDQ